MRLFLVPVVLAMFAPDTYLSVMAANDHTLVATVGQSGSEFVALSRDRYWRSGADLLLDAGPFVAGLEYATGRSAVLVGKPSLEFFGAALALLGSDAAGTLMIGDDLWSDVQGAQRAGLQGWLVRTGKFQPDLLPTSGVHPDRVLDSVADLLQLFD